MKTIAQKEIARLQRQIAKLEARVAKEAERKLAKGRRKVTALARQLGYRTPQELISALFGSAAKSAPRRLQFANENALGSQMRTARPSLPISNPASSRLPRSPRSMA